VKRRQRLGVRKLGRIDGLSVAEYMARELLSRRVDPPADQTEHGAASEGEPSNG